MGKCRTGGGSERRGKLKVSTGLLVTAGACAATAGVGCVVALGYGVDHSSSGALGDPSFFDSGVTRLGGDPEFWNMVAQAGFGGLAMAEMVIAAKLPAAASAFKMGTGAAKGGPGPGAFRRSGKLGALSDPVPMQMRTVKNVAEKAGVGLKGMKIKIVRDPDLLGRQVFGHANPNGTITLYPDAFSSTEMLVKTLGHERTHLMQFKIFGKVVDHVQGALFEQAAFGIENTFWGYFLGK